MKKVDALSLFLPILSLLFLISAGHPLSQEVKIEQQNGVTIVSNPKTPCPENGIPIRLVFTEELSIGAEEGEEYFMFGNRVYFNVDVDGNFYVNDWDKKCIRKFDPEGNYLLTIGRPGQGPGEFQNVWQPRFDKNDNLYVSDIVGAKRISLFDRDGTFLELIKVPISLDNIFINSLGFYIGFLSTMVEDPKGATVTSVLGLFDPQFQLLSEFHKQMRELKSPAGRGSESYAQFLADSIGDDAFKPTPTYFLAEDDFIYFGFPESYEIKVFSPDGKLEKVIQREYDPLKIGKKHIEGEYSLIDLFDQQGKYIAQFEAKIPVDNLLFKNGKAYALAIENDYRYVKQYGIEIQEYRNKRWIKTRHNQIR